MRLPNGFGSITKLSGKRRKPYVIRVTTGWTDSGKEIRKVIAYAKDSKEALQILNSYHHNSYDLSYKDMLVEELFDKWITRKSDKISDKNESLYRSTFKNHCKPTHRKKVVNVTNIDIQTLIDDCQYGYTIKKYIKQIFSQLKTFCKFINIECNWDPELIEIPTPTKSTLHKPFTKEEINKLWSNLNDVGAIYSLILIYTGMRPSELLKLEVSNIHLDERYMIGGIKTKAGIDRIIPIHKNIFDLISNLKNDDEKYLLYNIHNKQMTYKNFLTKFQATMERLEMNHTPHDGRHSFATFMDNSGANKLCIKLIMGHAVSDVTDGIYTHKNIQQLVEAIDQLII